MACGERGASVSVAQALASPPVPAGAPEGPGIYVAADGRIRVLRPVGDHWECTERPASGGGTVGQVVECREATEDVFFFMSAREYALPDGTKHDARTLAETVFRENYDEVFSNVEYRSQGPVTHQGHSGWEVELRLLHRGRGAIGKLERIVVGRDRTFVVSAEGAARVYDGLRPVARRWLAGAWFTDLAR